MGWREDWRVRGRFGERVGGVWRVGEMVVRGLEGGLEEGFVRGFGGGLEGRLKRGFGWRVVTCRPKFTNQKITNKEMDGWLDLLMDR